MPADLEVTTLQDILYPVGSAAVFGYINNIEA